MMLMLVGIGWSYLSYSGAHTRFKFAMTKIVISENRSNVFQRFIMSRGTGFSRRVKIDKSLWSKKFLCKDNIVHRSLQKLSKCIEPLIVDIW